MDISSENDAMSIEIHKKIKSEKIIDYNKLNVALSDGVNSKINKVIYKVNEKWTNDNREIKISEKTKLLIQ